MFVFHCSRSVLSKLDVQAPLLAYNHFVEALFVLNDCRAGLHGAGSAAIISDTDMADATEGSLAQLKGSAPSARAKREAIYRSADRLLLNQNFPSHAQLGLPCALNVSDTEAGCTCELGYQLDAEGGSAETEVYCSHCNIAEGNQYHY